MHKISATTPAGGLAAASGASEFRESPAKYWNESELMKTPAYRAANFPDSEADGLQAILYDGMNLDGISRKVFAYIGYPEGQPPGGGFPAIVQVHGGGGTAYPNYVKMWNKRGYAVIAMDWYNQRPLQSGTVPLEGGIMDTSRENIIRNVGNIVLAHSLLRSLPNVNPEKTGYIGISWGSIFGAMVAAIDGRFRFMLQVYCGGVMKNSENITNGRFLHAAKSPIYWLQGPTDLNITIDSQVNGWSEAPTTVNKTLVIELPHGHCGYEFSATYRIADAVLKGGVPIPKLGKNSFKKGVLRAVVLEKGKGICRCELCYTTDKVSLWHKKAWKTVPAEFDGKSVSAVVPADAAQCFFAAFDEDDRYCCGTGDVLKITKE